jgi:hypothetical protein
MPSSQRILVNKFLVRHKYSMIVNDDDYYHPQFIKECLNVLKNKNIDMVYCLYKTKKLYNSFTYYQPISKSKFNYDNQFMLQCLLNNNIAFIKKNYSFIIKKTD